MMMTVHLMQLMMINLSEPLHRAIAGVDEEEAETKRTETKKRKRVGMDYNAKSMQMMMVNNRWSTSKAINPASLVIYEMLFSWILVLPLQRHL